MWEYETRFGTFWICVDQPGVCELWLEDDRLGNYKNIEEASEAVRFYIQRESGTQRDADLETSEEDWGAADYDDLEETDEIDMESSLDSWHFSTDLGTFQIHSNSVGMYDLRFNDICLRIFNQPQEAADAVARGETGHKKWDRRGPVEKPSSFSEWSAGFPEES